jgi:hypothetical protein
MIPTAVCGLYISLLCLTSLPGCACTEDPQEAWMGVFIPPANFNHQTMWNLMQDFYQILN